jgi:very-short-patch-repair endonuclease
MCAKEDAVARGELIVVHAGVYAVAYRRVEPVALAMAAVLACGVGAVLSHGSAAALWDLGRWPRVRPLVDPAQNPTRSGLEDLLLPWLARHRLPVPRLNVYLHGYEVDAYFEVEDLILELDGWEHHRSRDSFASDRERDAHHLAHGTVTVRVVPERLTDGEAHRHGRTLARRRS